MQSRLLTADGAKELLHLPREILSGFREGFRGEESGRSHSAGQQSVGSLKLVADSKVCDLDVAVLSHQQVRRFHVSVDDLLVMYYDYNEIPFEKLCSDNG